MISCKQQIDALPRCRSATKAPDPNNPISRLENHPSRKYLLTNRFPPLQKREKESTWNWVCYCRRWLIHTAQAPVSSCSLCPCSLGITMAKFELLYSLKYHCWVISYTVLHLMNWIVNTAQESSSPVSHIRKLIFRDISKAAEAGIGFVRCSIQCCLHLSVCYASSFPWPSPKPFFPILPSVFSAPGHHHQVCNKSDVKYWPNAHKPNGLSEADKAFVYNKINVSYRSKVLITKNTARI